MPFEPAAALDLGLSFRFSDLPNFRGDSHWDYLHLEVFHPSSTSRLGFLRIAYVPHAMGQAINRERLLLAQIKGHTIYSRARLKRGEEPFFFKDPSTWDNWKKDPEMAARYVMENCLKMGWSQWNSALKERDEAGLVSFVEEHRPYLNEHTQPAVDKLFDFAVNKADVDYIELDSHCRGSGIGRMMYEAMAHYLDENLGITLNASSTQTPEAQRCWQRMKKEGRVEAAEDGRLFFVHGVSQSTLAGRQVRPHPMPLPKRRRGPKLA